MSVYKDKKRGTYYVSFSQKDISTGKFRHVTKRGFLTSKEAKQWERENYGKSSEIEGFFILWDIFGTNNYWRYKYG